MIPSNGAKALQAEEQPHVRGMYARMYVYIYIYMYIFFIYLYVYTCIHTYIRIHIHAHIHTFILTCMHTCIHAYIHLYMDYMGSPNLVPPLGPIQNPLISRGRLEQEMLTLNSRTLPDRLRLWCFLTGLLLRNLN